MKERRRVLSIDGGGVKGVIPLAFLAEVESTTGKLTADHFDLIAGTSTGGIIALGLGLRIPAQEILEWYERMGPKIFRRQLGRLGLPVGALRSLVSQRHNEAPLREALRAVLGDAELGDCSTRLAIPALDRQNGDVHVFKTSHHGRLTQDWKVSCVDVACATSAAPVYFAAHRIPGGESLLDGGLWANNPVAVAVVEAIGVLGWERTQTYVLSLGCSQSAEAFPGKGGILQWRAAKRVVDLALRGQSSGALGMAQLLTGDTAAARRVYRYQHPAPSGRFQLDDPRYIDEFRGIGARLARHAMPDMRTVFFGEPCQPFAPVHGRANPA